MEVSLVFFLKPDAVARRYAGARSLKMLMDNASDIEFLCFEEIRACKDFLADQHYVEHKGKFFFDWLVDYIASGPILVSIIRTTNEGVSKIREILGPTFPEKAEIEAPNSIRARYGIMAGVNIAHASDSTESAKREASIWIPYLRDEFRIDISKSNPRVVEDAIQGYIQTYIDYPMVDPIRYRELLRLVISDIERRHEVETRIAKLLALEMGKEYVLSSYSSKLAKIIVDSVLLSKSKR
ncbi:MAG: hypothetical protein NDP13_02010 [Crenarchaeota archaeon]|nr:hypothetical protein [Thermoproteota archaeon]MCR8455461.1 hypothetical protein [Thermoproteota archaeon]MCR8487308.1 hypothetical protein [Thermoproteota archaeon]MCR8501624.1 hypothetical protein [Thermoproteota archaeon]